MKAGLLVSTRLSEVAAASAAVPDGSDANDARSKTAEGGGGPFRSSTPDASDTTAAAAAAAESDHMLAMAMDGRAVCRDDSTGCAQTDTVHALSYRHPSREGGGSAATPADADLATALRASMEGDGDEESPSSLLASEATARATHTHTHARAHTELSAFLLVCTPHLLR